MALHKEDYGLIYNDDGSLCVTLRDDAPFEGVKSFAVEEGTINGLSSILRSDSYLLNYFKSGRGTTEIDTTVTPPVENQKVIKHYATLDDSYVYAFDTNGISYMYSSPAKMQVTAGSYVTFSIWAKGQNGGEEIELFIFEYPDDSSQFSSPPAKTTFNLTTEWKRYTFTIQTRSDTQRVWPRVDNDVAGATVYWCAPQLEKKPFATSFVDGTRPHGIVKLTNPPLLLDNFVINLWFKPTRYPSETNKWWHLFDVSYNASASQGLVLCAPPSAQGGIPSNTLSLTVKNSSSTFTRYNLGFDLSAEIGKWHMITLISNGSIVDVYIDGEKQVSATNDIQRSAIEFVVFGRYFGNISGTGMENGFLMSDVLFASYDHTIWTAEYIQELYNMRRPFSVPPRMPII